jgi:protein-L-isoaspartate(D-aspartate) O-methyltransferase
MVETQIKGRGITSPRLIEALERVPRHEFVPEGSLEAAYADRPVPIGEGQTISQPYIVALMIDLCELEGGETVLEIGTGSGYVAALLSRMVEMVYTVERFPDLCRAATVRLNSLGYENIQCIEADGFEGYEPASPYDAVILSAAPPEIPRAILSQLKEGGRVVAPVGKGSQYLVRVQREGEEFSRTTHGGVRFVPMIRGTE